MESIPENIGNVMNGHIAYQEFAMMLELSESMMVESPSVYLGYWWKGRALTFLGRPDDALDAFFEALNRADSDFVESKVCSSIANVYNVKRDYQQTLNFTEKARELNPDNVVAIIAQSIALTKTGKKKQAKQLLDDNWSKYLEEYQQACAHAVLGQKDKMLEQLAKSIQGNPHQKITIQHDPDFRDYLGDSGFLKLIKG